MAPNRSMSPDLALVPASGSPPPAMGKREKRKQLINDKLQSMIAGFSANLRAHYEAQMTVAQVDINTIMRANPYQNKPLEDGGEEIVNMISELFGGQLPVDPAAESSFTADAGKWNAQYVKQVNDLMEDRDRAITMLANKHNGQLDEIERKHQFHVEVAKQEHRNLSETIRQRLYTTLDKRRRVLMAEKEALDIGDSNAAALHPDQFRHVHPSSPGGIHNARKTRAGGARNRVGDHEDTPTAITAQDNRRKRKAAFEDTDGSPGPTSRYTDMAGSQYKNVKAKLAHTQYDAQAYSVERLFTEKELAMNMNQASLAAQHFLVKLKGNTNGTANGTGEGTNSLNGNGVENDDTHNVPAIVNDRMEHDEDSTPAAAEMDRAAGASQFSTHQTRGATRNALTDLANIAEGRMPHVNYNIPQFVPAIMGSKANGAAPSPAPLTASEIEQDFALFARVGTGFDDPINNQLLSFAADKKKPSAFMEYRYQAPAAIASVASTLDREDGLSAANALLAGVGGVAMSRQTSRTGSDAAGGLPMSRTGSAIGGGVGLRRTASWIGRGGGRARA